MHTFAPMFVTKAKKFYQKQDGTITVTEYYRLTKSYRDAKGVKHNRSVLCMGTLDGFTARERDELADLLTSMIEKGQYLIHENKQLLETAVELYTKYRESKYAKENDPILIAEAERKKREWLRDAVTIKLSSLTQHEARAIGCENLCHSTMRMLKIREYLTMRGWSRFDIDVAMMQVIARAIYPYSELKTVRFLRENTALAEIFKIPKEKITKDLLYKSALRLWDEHRGLEDWLHERVCDIFHIEEKILLFDITNTYFEGRYDESKILKHGRSKEKRSDCKIVVLAAVVNTEGLLVRTSIYEGNKHDSKTLKEVIGSVSNEPVSNARRIVVMDAGFYSSDNVKWLSENGFDYITVLPSAEARFTPSSDNVVKHKDCRKQEIRLQLGTVTIEDVERKALLIDSDAKAVKEKSMYEQACCRYEEGLECIKAGIAKKHGTKKRDAVNKRLGKLDEKYGAIRKNYTVEFTYEGSGDKEIAVAMTWKRNGEKSGEVRKFHGKYVLLTSLDENDEVNIWSCYNVIRTVEETFHILKTDLDIRPVYHKGDDGIKAHINLAVLAFWVVSVTKHRLKIKGYENVRWDEIMRIASTQVIVTAKMETEDGETIRIRQSTEAEDKLSAIYSLLDINPHPLGKIKSVVHTKTPSKKVNTENQLVT